jgi:hypothetical protein
MAGSVVTAYSVYLTYLFVGGLIVGLALGAYGNGGLKQCVFSTFAALRRHTDPVNGWSLQLIKRDHAFLHTMLLSVAYALVLLVATLSLALNLGWTGPNEFAHINNDIFATAGPLFPFALLLVQVVILPYSYLEEQGVVRGHHAYRCLPSGWTLSLFVIFLLMAFVRMVTYGFIKGTHENSYCSDHVWLATCMIGCAQTQLYVAHVSGMKLGFGCRTLLLCILCWATVIFTMLVSWVTVRYYHSVQAIWTAYVVGTLIFSGISFWWIGVFRSQGFQETCVYVDGGLGERAASLLGNDVECNKEWNNEAKGTPADNVSPA